jgi:predicted transcriptional regulator
METDEIILLNEQRELIDEVLRDIEKGNYFSNEDANNEIEKWLRK